MIQFLFTIFITHLNLYIFGCGMGINFTPASGFFDLKQWNTLEIRYGHYSGRLR